MTVTKNDPWKTTAITGQKDANALAQSLDAERMKTGGTGSATTGSGGGGTGQQTTKATSTTATASHSAADTFKAGQSTPQAGKQGVPDIKPQPGTQAKGAFVAEERTAAKKPGGPRQVTRRNPLIKPGNQRLMAVAGQGWTVSVGALRDFDNAATSFRRVIASASTKLRLGRFWKLVRRGAGRLAMRAAWGSLGPIMYVMDTPEVAAGTFPAWRRRITQLDNIMRRSSDPFEQLNCLRKMAVVIYTKQKYINASFVASLLAARKKFENADDRDALVRQFGQIINAERSAMLRAGRIMDVIVARAAALIKAVRTAYGWNKGCMDKLRYFENAFNAMSGAARAWSQKAGAMRSDVVSVINTLGIPA